MPKKAESTGGRENGSKCGQSFVATVDAGDASRVHQGDSVAAWNTGATADLVCFRWLARRSRILGRRGNPRATTYPSQARFRFGAARLGEVRHAADNPAGIAGT